VAVTADHVLHALQTLDDHIGDLAVYLVHCCFTPGHFNLEENVRKTQFAPVFGIIVFECALDCVVGDVRDLVVSLTHVQGVILTTESPKSEIIQPHFKRPERCNQNLNPEVKFLVVNQKRVGYLFRDDAGLLDTI